MDVILAKVSSHAPVRGHRTTDNPALRRSIVSSHAPVRGHRIRQRATDVDHMFQVMPP